MPRRTSAALRRRRRISRDLLAALRCGRTARRVPQRRSPDGELPEPSGCASSLRLLRLGRRLAQRPLHSAPSFPRVPLRRAQRRVLACLHSPKQSPCRPLQALAPLPPSKRRCGLRPVRRGDSVGPVPGRPRPHQTRPTSISARLRPLRAKRARLARGAKIASCRSEVGPMATPDAPRRGSAPRAFRAAAV